MSSRMDKNVNTKPDSSFLAKAGKLMQQKRLLIVILLMAAAYFMLYYLTDPARPAGMFTWLFGFKDTAQYPLGWWGYYDQSQYLRMANTLANFDLAGFKQAYAYGVGYPLAAVPALWLGITKDPFVVFNFGSFLFATYAIYRAATRFISPLGGFLAAFGMVFATPILAYTAQPWNSTICLLAFSGLLIVASEPKIKPRHVFSVGFLVGWAFAARYIDVVWLIPLGAAALYRGSFKNLLRYSWIGIIGLCIWILPVLYSHNLVFGSPFKTPYVNHIGLKDSSSDQQLGAYKLNRIPAAFKGMFLGPRLEYSKDTDRGLLVLMFWTVMAIPGSLILIRRSKSRVFFSTFLGVFVVSSVFYLSFRASTPESLKFGVLHYFKMFWPGLVILAVAFFDREINRLVSQMPKVPEGKSTKQKSNR